MPNLLEPKDFEQYFSDSLECKQRAKVELSQPIAKAAKQLIDALTQGNKILACGNGGSAGDAQHFAAELLNRFETERAPLPAVAITTDSSTLTAVANDYDYFDIFAKQVEALGQPGDVLLAISTSGGSENVNRAISAAHKQNMSVVALSGKTGGAMAELLQATDTELRAPSERTCHTQEIHIMLIHCLCLAIDQAFLTAAA